jgi:hypothetical protein
MATNINKVLVCAVEDEEAATAEREGISLLTVCWRTKRLFALVCWRI